MNYGRYNGQSINERDAHELGLTAFCTVCGVEHYQAEMHSYPDGVFCDACEETREAEEEEDEKPAQPASTQSQIAELMHSTVEQILGVKR